MQEVVDMEPDQIEPAPHIGTQLNAALIKGMGKCDNKFVMILDIDRIFFNDMMDLVNDALDTTV